MSERTVAFRYARAVFDVALKEADLDQVGDDLDGFRILMDEHEPLKSVLLNPGVPVGRKRGAVDALVPHVASSTVARKVLGLLAERDRLVLLPSIIDAYRARVMEHRQMVRAEVTTAVPLPDDKARALEQSFAQATGKQVSVTVRVDPSIVGGVVARIGSVVYDGSVVGQLQRMKDSLVETAG